MATSLHKNLGIAEVHCPISFEYADQTARENASGLTSDDLRKFARQLDNNSIWMLIAITPTWVSILGAVTNDAQLKRAAGDIASFTEKTTPVANDLLLIEDSADSGNKKKLKIVNLPSGVDTTAIHKVIAGEIAAMTEKVSPVTSDFLIIEDSADSNSKKKVKIGNLPLTAFGQSYQYAAAEARSTTTSDIFQTKVTLTTPALTGTFRVNWSAVVDHANASSSLEAQLYNSTDGVIIGAILNYRLQINSEIRVVGGFADIVFTGASKTFLLQHRSVNGTATTGIQAAKIDLWRVG